MGALRSVFVPWSIALGDSSEILLDNLTRCTRVNGVELLDFLSKIEKATYESSTESASRVLPSDSKFDLPLSVTTKDEFRSALSFMDSAKSREFKITCNFVPLWLSSSTLTRLSLVDAKGRRITGPGDFPVYGCPNNPDTVKIGQFMMRKVVASWPSLDIVAINHVEYPHLLFWAWPKVDIESLFSCFCQSCRRRATEQGLDFSRIKREVRSLLDSFSSSTQQRFNWTGNVRASNVISYLVKRPDLVSWLSFRMASMTKYTESLIEAGREAAKEHNPKLRFGMEFQLPSLSNVVGTDFQSLSSRLDLLIPKFPDYLTGSVIPMFAKEAASRSSTFDEAMLRDILRESLGIGPGPKEYLSLGGLKHALLYSNTFDYSVVARQLKVLRHVIGGTSLYPYIWENNNDLEGLRRKIEALSSCGFDDFYLWCWEEGLARKQLEASKGIL